MQIDKNEICEKVKQYVKNGVRNRNKILSSLLSEDENVMKVLELYRKRKSENDIMVELKMPIEDVRENMAIIDNVSKMIDSTTAWLTSKKYFIDRILENGMPCDNDEELRKSIAKARNETTYKRKNARNFLNKYFYKYQLDTKNGLVDKNQILKDLPELVKNVKLLECKVSDVLYLVSMYDDIGEYKRAENILGVYDPKNMEEIDRRNYYILNDRTKKLRNREFVDNLCEKGYSYEQIYQFCEKEISEYRAPYLDLKFVSNIISEYKRREKGIINQKQDIRKKEKEKDELEL